MVSALVCHSAFCALDLWFSTGRVVVVSLVVILSAKVSGPRSTRTIAIVRSIRPEV